MNQEFMLLSDGNIAVTDENGQISKREYETTSQDVLLAENKIELTEDKLIKLEMDLHENKGVIRLARRMLKVQPVIILLGTLGMLLYGLLSSAGDLFTAALYSGVKGFGYSSIIGGTGAIYFSKVKTKYTKKVDELDAEIAIARQLKEDYEQELATIKGREQGPKSSAMLVNEPVSLIEQTKVMEMQIADELDRAYRESPPAQPQKRVLRRKR